VTDPRVSDLPGAANGIERIPGISPCILHGESAHKMVRGVVNDRMPMPVAPETLFRMASVTKSYTGHLPQPGFQRFDLIPCNEESDFFMSSSDAPREFPVVFRRWANGPLYLHAGGRSTPSVQPPSIDRAASRQTEGKS
jgi:hypothetical protein